MAMYFCKIVDVDDCAIATKIFAAANDVCASGDAKPKAAKGFGSRHGRGVLARRTRAAPSEAPQLTGLAYAAAAVLLIAVASIGALLPHV
jgi:hypothetical protein